MVADSLPTTIATMGSIPIMAIIAPKMSPPAIPPTTPPMIRCTSEVLAVARVLVAIATSFFSPFGVPNPWRGAPLLGSLFGNSSRIYVTQGTKPLKVEVIVLGIFLGQPKRRGSRYVAAQGKAATPLYGGHPRAALSGGDKGAKPSRP